MEIFKKIKEENSLDKKIEILSGADEIEKQIIMRTYSEENKYISYKRIKKFFCKLSNIFENGEIFRENEYEDVFSMLIFFDKEIVGKETTNKKTLDKKTINVFYDKINKNFTEKFLLDFYSVYSCEWLFQSLTKDLNIGLTKNLIYKTLKW